MIFLSKFLPLPKKSILPNIKIENEGFVLKKTFINLNKRTDLFPHKTIATLLFRRAKTLLGRKKSWLDTKLEALKTEKKRALP